MLDWPGVRVMRSARFRVCLASVLTAGGLIVLAGVLLRQAADPAGQYAFDFQVYYTAAGNVARGQTPYAASMFTGPIAAQGALLYKYPPFLAQLLVPLSALPLGVAAAVWFVLQFLAVYSATWLAARAGGAARSIETLAWCAAATTLFLPVFDTLWKGNVSGFLALAVAASVAGGMGAGVGVVSATLIKTTPVVLVAPTAVAGRRAFNGLLLGLPVLAVSMVLSPGAWVDFARIIPNLLAGSSNFPTNLAPDNLVSMGLPGLALAGSATRVLTVGLGIACLVTAVLLARSRPNWPAALTLAVAASLLLPSATWYHYLAVLLPLAAFAWPRAGRVARTGLAAGATMVTAGLAALPLTVVGAALMVAATISATRRRPTLTPRMTQVAGSPAVNA